MRRIKCKCINICNLVKYIYIYILWIYPYFKNYIFYHSIVFKIDKFIYLWYYYAYQLMNELRLIFIFILKFLNMLFY